MPSFTPEELAQLEELKKIAEQYQDTTGWSMRWYQTFSRIAEELRRLWLLEKPLPTQEEEKEFYHRAYHVCHTGCPMPCPSRI